MKRRGFSSGPQGEPEHHADAEQVRREGILRAAKAQFQHYGYQKTTVADIARHIQLSSAYLYIFFDSKQAIGEAVCTRLLSDLMRELAQALDQIKSPTECIRFIFFYLHNQSIRMFHANRKMHDLITLAFRENWNSLTVYNSALITIIRDVVLRGRQNGEFERKTSLEETCQAIRHTTESFFHPILLEQSLRELNDEADAVANLVLRSLIS